MSIGGAARQRYRARIAMSAERSEMWPRITDRYRNYAAYQARTEREIPLVLLEPTSSGVAGLSGR